MENRVLMARFQERGSVQWPAALDCACGCEFTEGEVVLLYPNPEHEDVRLRDVVCLTCHFWFVHTVRMEMGL